MSFVDIEEAALVTLVDGFVPVPGPPGAGVSIKGELDDIADLPTDAAEGDGYLVDGDLWMWNGTDWQNLGPFQGPTGATGPAGAAGDTGPAGATGPTGAQGPTGATGTQGPAGPQGAAGTAGATGPQGPQGAPGVSTIIRGEVATVAALPPVGTVAVGDAYIVTADGDLYTSTGTAWLSVGQIVGPAGPTGATGTTGPQGSTGAQGPAGTTGATGATGPQGDQGEAGGSLLSAFWQFSNTTTAPPAAGQVRSNAGNTTLWVHKTDTDGFDRTFGLSTVAVGNHIYVRAANGTALNLAITATADSGTYMTFTTTVDSGTITKGARTQLNFVLAPPVGLPSGGTTDQALLKTSSTDYATAWTTLTKTTVGLANVDNTADTAKPISTATQTALDAKGPVRRPLNAQTGTTYAPVVADENMMVTLSNAAAITVTLPQNSTQAFPVGAEVDFLWLGLGQPTFAAGSGATVNATPGLKLRAQYSAATAKKISTNGWVVLGDLSS